VLRVALRQIARWYRKTSGRRLGPSGSVTAIQRFGSALNLNLHFHVLHLDGAFDRGADGKLRFFTARPTTEDVEALVLEIALACERWLGKQGFAGEEEDSQVDEDDAQGVLQLASLRGTQALGERAGRRVKRVITLGGKEVALSPRCASYAGYNVHANVALRAREREGLERLCRYVLRRVWSDGTSALDLSPLEFVEKLAALVPPPRANQVLQAGILAGNAARRDEVIPKVPSSTSAELEARAALRLLKPGKAPAPVTDATPLCWAELLKRVFAVDGWACPDCGRRMSLRTVVLDGKASGR
jgi:hypothetical protein